MSYLLTHVAYLKDKNERRFFPVTIIHKGLFRTKCDITTIKGNEIIMVWNWKLYPKQSPLNLGWRRDESTRD